MPAEPHAIPEAKIQKLEEAFRIDATDKEACHYADVKIGTYYDWLEKYEAFAERMRKAQTYSFMLMKSTVAKAARKGDGNLALKWLRSRQRSLYYEKTEQEVKVEKDGAAELADAMTRGVVPSVSAPDPESPTDGAAESS